MGCNLKPAREDQTWLTRYCIGSLETDAGVLAHVFGEVYIPVVEGEDPGRERQPRKRRKKTR